MKKDKKEKAKGLISEFKAFISRGNVLDMAVGVIIGGAFNAIVTSVVNILMSVCTWRIPGGIKGLITVLPAANDAQKGLDAAIGLGQKFDASQLQGLAKTLAEQTYGPEVVAETPTLIENVKTTILGKYSLHGTTYVYNMSSSIDWGSFINAIISFLIIAVTLFIIVKVAAAIGKKRAEMKAKSLEAYYEKHPEERPVPPEPGKPEPTTNEILLQIKDLLAEKKAE